MPNTQSCPFCKSMHVVMVERVPSLTEYRCGYCLKHWADVTRPIADAEERPKARQERKRK